MPEIQALKMPKWGLSMTEGTINTWYVDEGGTLEPGQELCDIETSKINNTLEAVDAGVLRRRIADEGDTLVCGALIGVVAGEDASDEDIDAFIADYEENFDPDTVEVEGGLGAAPEIVDVEGRRIQYLKAGPDPSDCDKTPVLFIHGFGGDLNSWMFVQPALAEDRPTFAIDLPGHGASEKSLASGDIDELTNATKGFLDALELETVHVVAHSMGGAVALKLAIDSTDRVTSLALIGTAGLSDSINGEYIEGFIAGKRRKDMKPVLEMLFADPTLVGRDMVEDVLRFKRLDGVPEALRKIAEAVFPGGKQSLVMRNEVANLGMPIMAVWGRQDRISDAGQADGLPANIEVEILEGAGHMPQMEAAQAVAALLARHIEGADPR